MAKSQKRKFGCLDNRCDLTLFVNTPFQENEPQSRSQNDSIPAREFDSSYDVKPKVFGTYPSKDREDYGRTGSSGGGHRGRGGGYQRRQGQDGYGHQEDYQGEGGDGDAGYKDQEDYRGRDDGFSGPGGYRGNSGGYRGRGGRGDFRGRSGGGNFRNESGRSGYDEQDDYQEDSSEQENYRGRSLGGNFRQGRGGGFRGHGEYEEYDSTGADGGREGRGFQDNFPQGPPGRGSRNFDERPDHYNRMRDNYSEGGGGRDERSRDPYFGYPPRHQDRRGPYRDEGGYGGGYRGGRSSADVPPWLRDEVNSQWDRGESQGLEGAVVNVSLLPILSAGYSLARLSFHLHG